MTNCVSFTKLLKINWNDKIYQYHFNFISFKNLPRCFTLPHVRHVHRLSPRKGGYVLAFPVPLFLPCQNHSKKYLLHCECGFLARPVQPGGLEMLCSLSIPTGKSRTFLSPPEMSESSFNLKCKVNLQLWQNVVVNRTKIVHSIHISIKGKRSDHLATSIKAQPNCPFLLTKVDAKMEWWGLSYRCVFTDFVRVHLTIHGKCIFLANNHRSQELISVSFTSVY